MPPNHECIMESRIEALEKANDRHGTTHKEFYERLRDLEKWQGVQNERYKTIEEKLDDLTAMVKELSGKSGKRWDSMVDKIAWLIVGGAVSLLLVGVGLPV